MNSFKIFLCICLFASVSFGSFLDFSEEKKFVTLKELERNSQSSVEIYLSLLKIEIMKKARKEHKKETFSFAAKLNNEVKQTLDDEITPKITQEKLNEVKKKWGISSSLDKKLLTKTIFRTKNADLFKAPEKKKDIFWVADFMKFPVYDIARSYQFSVKDTAKQINLKPTVGVKRTTSYENNTKENDMLLRYSSSFPTLSQITAVMYNRDSFIDGSVLLYLTFLYTLINQFPIFLSMIGILWLSPLFGKLDESNEKGLAIVFSRIAMSIILIIFIIVLIFFAFIALVDVLKALLVFFGGIIFAAPLLFLFLFGLSFSTESIVFFEDSSMVVIITEMIRYKLIYEMGLNIDLNHEFLWFLVKLFVLLITSNKIYFAISIATSYFGALRNYKHFFAISGVSILFVIMYISDSKHLIALFEIAKRYFI